MASRKRLLIVLTPGFPQDEQDTTCLTYLQHWVLELQKRDLFDLKVLVFQYPYEARTYRWNGVEVRALGGKNRKQLHKLWIWMQAFWQIRKWVQRQPDALIQTFWLTDVAWVGEWAARWWRLPLFSTILGQDALPSNPYLKVLNLKRHQLIALSKYVVRDWHLPVQVIPFGLPSSPTPHNAVRPIDLIGIGSLIPLKDYEAFVRITADIRADFPHVQAQLVGEGPEKTKLQAQIEAAGLTKQVQLVGLLPYPEVNSRLQQAKILLHTSTYEAQALVYLEALANGAYLVCRQVGFVPDHPKVFSYQTEAEAVAHIRHILSLDKPDFAPYLHWSVGQAVERYVGMYCQSPVGKPKP